MTACEHAVRCNEGARADEDALEDDPRPRRWNHAVVVFIACAIVVGVLSYGIADGCLCATAHTCSRRLLCVSFVLCLQLLEHTQAARMHKHIPHGSWCMTTYRAWESSPHLSVQPQALAA